jgi:Na+/H+ antiporter NhaC
MRRSSISLLLFSLVPAVSMAGDAAANADHYGILTLLPPILAIILAFTTRNVILSLFIGIYSGAFLLGVQNNGFVGGFLGGFQDIIGRVINSMADSWNAGIILQVLTIGGLIALISKMGGARAVAEALAKKAKSPVSAQIITWIMGIFIFFDDYANALIVGPIMRPITDKMNVSRERLAFIIDATAAPIAGLALISTWIGYEISVIKDGYAMIGMENINAYSIFVETIPYRFYNILMLAFVFISSFLSRDFGPMLKAERNARVNGVSDNSESSTINSDDHISAPKEGITYSIYSAIIPIGVLIVASFVGFYYNGLGTLEGEVLSAVNASPLSLYAIRETFGASDASVVLFQAALFASIVAVAMALAKKTLSLGEALETWVNGMKPLMITCVILLLAWSLSSVIKDLGTSTYLVSLLSDTIPRQALPGIVFVMASFIAFATGTSYGTMGILMPLCIPLANAIGMTGGLAAEDLHSFTVASIGAVLTGAIFGDHCSPISDTTIMSSMGAGCDHLEHVRTQLVYALAVAAISLVFGYLPAGLGVPIGMILPVAVLVTYLLVRFVGKPVDQVETEIESIVQ